MRRCCALLIVLTALAASASAAVRPQFEQAIADVQERVFPAVVFVKPIQESYYTGARRKMIAYGSGVIVSSDGLVVTNSHVVDKAVEIRCVLSDKTEVVAKLLGQDKEMDLALLQLEHSAGQQFPFAPLGDSDRLRAGEFVMAMGAPFGFVRSVSLGIVSNANRYLEASPYNLWVQTDAAINPGNSGGPLVSLRGEVVGINARGVFMADNIGFAIPSNRVTETIEAIRKYSEVPRSWIGVHLQPLRDFERSIFIEAHEGVMVSSVDRMSPAEAAGLQTGDRIVRVNGNSICGLYAEDLPAVRRFLAALPADHSAEIAFVRGDAEQEITLVPLARGKIEGDDLELREWDLALKEISKYTDRLLAYFRPEGVYIQGVKAGGNAAQSGLRVGDVVHSIDGQPVPDVDAARRIYERLDGLPRGRRRVRWQVLRGGYQTWVVLDFNRESLERRRSRETEEAAEPPSYAP